MTDASPARLDTPDLLTPESIHQACAALESPEALAELKARLLGRSGAVTQALAAVGRLSLDQRPTEGARVSALKKAAEAGLAEASERLRVQALDTQLATEAIDVTLPGLALPAGGLHPISCIYDELTGILTRLGYPVVEGPEVEDETHNFKGLNVPWYHPARDLQDTFWLEDGRLLRTHTSPVQLRYMATHEPDFRVAVRGKVYRHEATDATHESMFHQLEGLVVGDVSMADLRGTIQAIAEALFGPGTPVRFQPSYYPFVEPGADFAAYWQPPGKPGRWLELGGCGMVHPRVFDAADALRAERGLAPAYAGKRGFAFGLGPERIAMLRYGVSDIRDFYANESRFLEQFRGC